MQQAPKKPYSPLSLSIYLLPLLCLFALLVSACGSSPSTTTSATATSTTALTATTAPSGPVQVAYAASLESIMEKQIAPAFNTSTGYTFQGEAKGSSALANEIKGHLIRPDVFISASPGVDKKLLGAANGSYVSWYINFGRSEMVIGYNPKSRFAADFKAAVSGSKPWYQVLEEPGLRLGRTDPILDPKGQATIYLAELAEKYYKQSGLSQKLLGTDENTSQIFPEEELVARLGAGQLDAGFFYINEAKAANIPYITLPDQINLGNPTLAATYETVHWTNPKTKEISNGGPIVFTITIPSTVQNQAGALAFVNFILSSQGQTILQNEGLLSTKIKASPDASAVPQSLQQYIQS